MSDEMKRETGTEGSPEQHAEARPHPRRRGPGRHAFVAVGIAVAILAFLSVRDDRLSRELDQRFDPDPSREVVLLTTVWCGYCEKARRFLDANGVRYRELDVETSEAGRRAWDEHGRMGVPIFLIDERSIFGLDVPAVVEALRLEPDPGARAEAPS